MGAQEGAFAEQPFGTPHLWLGLVGLDPPHLQQNFSLDSSAVVGGNADAFMVGKRLKGPVTRACVRPSCASSPLLFFFTLFLLTLFAQGNMRLTFLSPPCALAGEDGAAEAPGALTRAAPKQDHKKAVCSKPVVGRGSCDPHLLQHCAS